MAAETNTQHRILLPKHRTLSGGLMFTLPDTHLLVRPYNKNLADTSKFKYSGIYNISGAQS